MINANNIDTYVQEAKWKRNLGFIPDIQPDEECIVKMKDGSIGYGMHYRNYCWSLTKTAYPIMYYAVFNK